MATAAVAYHPQTMSSPLPDSDVTAQPAATGRASDAVPADQAGQPGTGLLLDQLAEDRLWLLRQIDAGRWPDLRLDLAALERELGQLLDQARERLGEG